jgi:5-methyltetrahydrofolate--homocysteine methyltransferase
MELIESIRQAIEALEEDKAEALVKEANEKGVEPLAIVQDGIVAGISGVGKKFEQGQYFVLELEQGGELAQRLVAMVEPRLSPGAVVGKGTIVMATVKGDLHDIISARAWYRSCSPWPGIMCETWVWTRPP